MLFAQKLGGIMAANVTSTARTDPINIENWLTTFEETLRANIAITPANLSVELTQIKGLPSRLDNCINLLNEEIVCLKSLAEKIERINIGIEMKRISEIRGELERLSSLGDKQEPGKVIPLFEEVVGLLEDVQIKEESVHLKGQAEEIEKINRIPDTEKRERALEIHAELERLPFSGNKREQDKKFDLITEMLCLMGDYQSAF